VVIQPKLTFQIFLEQGIDHAVQGHDFSIIRLNGQIVLCNQTEADHQKDYKKIDFIFIDI
jgi:hypothetical protein